MSSNEKSDVSRNENWLTKVSKEFPLYFCFFTTGAFIRYSFISDSKNPGAAAAAEEAVTAASFITTIDAMSIAKSKV